MSLNPIVLGLIVAAFGAFMVTLAWASITTRSAPVGAKAQRETPNVTRRDE